jgi:hypothetical protein
MEGEAIEANTENSAYNDRLSTIGFRALNETTRSCQCGRLVVMTMLRKS